jgi:hypothetical protein
MEKLRIMKSLRRLFISQQKIVPCIFRAAVASANTSVLPCVRDMQLRMKPAASNKERRVRYLHPSKLICIKVNLYFNYTLCYTHWVVLTSPHSAIILPTTTYPYVFGSIELHSPSIYLNHSFTGQDNPS